MQDILKIWAFLTLKRAGFLDVYLKVFERYI
jgi:hypothetical protein